MTRAIRLNQFLSTLNERNQRRGETSEMTLVFAPGAVR